MCLKNDGVILTCAFFGRSIWVCKRQTPFVKMRANKATPKRFFNYCLRMQISRLTGDARKNHNERRQREFVHNLQQPTFGRARDEPRLATLTLTPANTTRPTQITSSVP